MRKEMRRRKIATMSTAVKISNENKREMVSFVLYFKGSGGNSQCAVNLTSKAFFPLHFLATSQKFFKLQRAAFAKTQNSSSALSCRRFNPPPFSFHIEFQVNTMHEI